MLLKKTAVVVALKLECWWTCCVNHKTTECLAKSGSSSHGYIFLFTKLYLRLLDYFEESPSAYFDSFSTFQFLQVLPLFSERYSTTKRGVHPPSFHCQLISFNLRALDLLCQQEIKKRDDMTAMRRRKLHFKWWLVRLFWLSSGLDYQNVGGWGDTLNLPSNWNLKYKYFVRTCNPRYLGKKTE